MERFHEPLDKGVHKLELIGLGSSSVICEEVGLVHETCIEFLNKITRII